MKANKGIDASVVVSPSPKKLKQARLPFKLISDVPPSPDSPQPRKRKLSAPDTEAASKISKISKENGVKDDPIVLSDDDSEDELKTEKQIKIPNPFVKLVDTAFKKKLLKTKTPKKRKTSKNNNTDNATHEQPVDCTETKASNEEPMDVDINDENIENKDDKAKSNNTTSKTALTLKKQKKTDSNDTTSVNVQNNANEDEIVDLDNSSDDSADKSSLSKQEINDDKDRQSDENMKTKSESPLKIMPVTPKRSPRMKTPKKTNNDKSSLNVSTSSSKLDESINSAPSTPKATKKSTANSTGDDSLNESLNTSLTPKQLARKLESAKKRDEREKEKQEREKKRLQEKEERDKIKKEKEDQKKKEREEKEEAKKKEREEKEEQKRKEKEEKEKQKEVEKQMREQKEEMKRKEKEAKEEQKLKEKEAKEEERRKKQEALELEKQEQELKKKKAAEAFANFFVPKQKAEKDQSVLTPSKNNMLSSFTIKADMRLAPTVRKELADDKKKSLERLIKSQEVSESNLYVKNLKKGIVKPESRGKTWPLDDKDDVIIVEDELQPLDGVGEVINCESVREKLRPKLLSFHENSRPPYWGTWRRKSAAVKPRRPFGQDEKQLDYSVDSDDEWEEEQEGESISGSACGSETEDNNDDYEVDNEVFVPHGYLSDEEATMEDGDVLSLSPEAQQARLKHLEDEFESEMKKPTEKLKPRLYGLILENSDGGKPDNCVDALWNYFGKFTMIMGDATPLLQPSPEPEETEKKKKKSKKSTSPEGEQSTPKIEKKRKAKTDPKERKKAKVEAKMSTPEVKKSQLGINSFLTKLKSP